MCILNGIAVRKSLNYKQDILKIFILPAGASAVMGAAAYGTYTGLFGLTESNVVSLISAVIVGAAVYGILILKTGVLTEKDIRSMPKGAKLAGLLKKMHLI